MQEGRIQPTTVPERASRPKAVYWVLSLGLAAVFLYFSLRGIQWGSVWSTLRSANLAIVAGVVVWSSLTLYLRAYRWRVLLSARSQVSIPSAFWATSAGYLGNNMLPARAGEIIRTMMISRSTGLSRTYVLTTALSERIVDAIALVTISAMVLLFVNVEAGWISRAGRPFAILGLCGVAGIVLLPVLERFWFRMLHKTGLPASLLTKAEHILHQALDGVRSFHNPGRLASFLGLTTVIWLMDGLTTVACGQAIGLSISMPVALLLVAGLGLSSALPSTPGYVGIYQFVAAAILPQFGIDRNHAIAYIFLFQAIIYVVVLFWGSIGLSLGRKTLATTLTPETANSQA